MRAHHPAFVLAFCLVFTACGSDDDPMGPGAGGALNGTMTATLDGGPWSAVTIQVTRTGGFLSVAGSNTDPLAIGFTIQEAGTGTYTIGPGQVTSANITILSSVWTASTGQIAFTTIEADRVAGTFQFTAPLSVGSGAAERVVTSGVFDATY
jgi:hypothetical protein